MGYTRDVTKPNGYEQTSTVGKGPPTGRRVKAHDSFVTKPNGYLFVYQRAKATK